MPRTREQLKQAAADAEAWLDQLDPNADDVEVDDPKDLRDIAYALGAVASAEEAVSAAVAKARANGRSWGQIATILGMTRQATQKRYDVPAHAGRATRRAR